MTTKNTHDRETEERDYRYAYMSLTTEAVAHRLILMAESPRTFTAIERTALLYTAAARLRDPGDA